ncbi:hypothetical protein PG993_004283 [Apiospora rasikravindrae]|uniref:Uncharacterized protein n=1 Tax=Apiospora rasikravindrae TaxID=990691 RepID=A0ABR1TCB1_9PEZI
MAETGFLVPPWYRSGRPQADDMELCSIIWGASLCSAVFTAAKASHQTWTVCRRKKRVNAYIVMVWAEWISSVTISIVCWLFLKGNISPRSMQCILQIILNRVSILTLDRCRARQLQLATFAAITMINISVFCIWIPAQLQISYRYTHLNDVWDRTEKAVFAAIDAGLNAYFLWVVRTKLIANGLTKYWALFRYNIAMVCVSISLDLILIGSMSLPSGLIYIQFHPLTYLIKLHIELNLAELIAKVVQATNPLNVTDLESATTACEPSSPPPPPPLPPPTSSALGGMKRPRPTRSLSGLDSLDILEIDLGVVPMKHRGLFTGAARGGGESAAHRQSDATAVAESSSAEMAKLQAVDDGLEEEEKEKKKEARLSDEDGGRIYPSATRITWDDRVSIRSAPDSLTL